MRPKNTKLIGITKTIEIKTKISLFIASLLLMSISFKLRSQKIINFIKKIVNGIQQLKSLKIGTALSPIPRNKKVTTPTNILKTQKTGVHQTLRKKKN